MQKLEFCSLSHSGVHFSPIPPKFEGLYLSAQMELCDTSHYFYSGNMMNFRFVTFLGMLEELKILPEQKNVFFVKELALKAFSGYPLEIWSLKWVILGDLVRRRRKI